MFTKTGGMYIHNGWIFWYVKLYTDQAKKKYKVLLHYNRCVEDASARGEMVTNSARK